jgi:hypothetical protein
LVLVLFESWVAVEYSLAAAPEIFFWSAVALAVWDNAPLSVVGELLVFTGLAQAWAEIPRAMAMAVDRRVLFIVLLLKHDELDDGITEGAGHRLAQTSS